MRRRKRHAAIDGVVLIHLVAGDGRKAHQRLEPGLVNAQCAVTSDHVRAAAGGLAYDGPDELAACLDWFLVHPAEAARMGQNGGAYVRRNFDWDVVVARLRRALAV